MIEKFNGRAFVGKRIMEFWLGNCWSEMLFKDGWTIPACLSVKNKTLSLESDSRDRQAVLRFPLHYINLGV